VKFKKNKQIIKIGEFELVEFWEM